MSFTFQNLFEIIMKLQNLQKRFSAVSYCASWYVLVACCVSVTTQLRHHLYKQEQGWLFFNSDMQQITNWSLSNSSNEIETFCIAGIKQHDEPRRMIYLWDYLQC